MALVLVVDDEPDIRELIQMNLELAGHRVITASDGKEALESVRRELPDAILLDLMLPGLDGWEVLDQLKSRSGRDLSEIPVFMVTARTEPQNRLRGGIEGALRYITKPFDPAKLVEMLSEALAPGAPPEPRQRRQVQQSALEELARRETAGGGEPTTTPEPRVRLTRLEHTPSSSSPSPRLRNAREKVAELSAKQRQLLEALATRTPVTGVAQQLGMSRSNVYASLRRVSRKLGLKGTNELLALLRQGALLGSAGGPGANRSEVVSVPATLAAEVLAPWRARLRHLDGVDPPVIVACSGGPDSLALLALAIDAGLEPIAVHVDHGLRAGSDREAALVADAAARLGARFHAERVTVAAGNNLEARARDVRYAALERARVALGATAVLAGHTADDQAETVLLNLLRGSASAGLGGMPGRRDRIVRPLLALRRAETAEVCARLGLAPLDDPMNTDLAFLRVRVRREIIPALERAAGRDLVALLGRQADVLRAESDFLDGLARAAWPPGDGTAPAAPLAAMPVVLARRALRCWLGPPPPSFDEIERVLAVAGGEARATELAGGRRVRRSRGQLHVEPSG